MQKNVQILLVEDSIDDSELIVRQLEHEDFCVKWERVETANDLRAALLTQSWDIVLSDYTMPQFSAIDALKIISEIKPDLPCIIISGTIGEETAVKAMQAGAQDFFVKGRLTRLGAAVHRQLTEATNILQRRKAEQELRESEQRRWADHKEALKQEMETRKKIESLYIEAQESNRLKEEFLHNLSHELRTPMNAITGWAELLTKGECSTSDYPNVFSAIYRNAIAQNKLINDLLDQSRITTGKLTIEKKPVEFDKVVQAALESIQLSAQTKSILLTLKIESSEVLISGDPERLHEVVCNLLSNAVKFTPNGGRVDLKIFREGSMITLQVQDNGAGIDPTFLPYVFDRFRQADGSLIRRHGGLGLGLSIVRHLVELHGGQVEAQSDGIGKGTTLIARFPLIDAQTNSQLSKKLLSDLSNRRNLLVGLRVLIADDSPDALLLLDYILKKQGAEVIVANSGAKAFQLFKETHPHVFLCDIEMPEQNGYDLIHQIREYEYNCGTTTPAAALTAHVRPEDVEQAKAAGFNLHITKPVDTGKLVEAVVKLSGREFKNPTHWQNLHADQ